MILLTRTGFDVWLLIFWPQIDGQKIFALRCPRDPFPRASRVTARGCGHAEDTF